MAAVYDRGSFGKYIVVGCVQYLLLIELYFEMSAKTIMKLQLTRNSETRLYTEKIALNWI